MHIWNLCWAWPTVILKITNSGKFEPLLANPGKLIEKLFRNFSFLGHVPGRITGTDSCECHEYLFSFGKISSHLLDRITGKFILIGWGFQ